MLLGLNIPLKAGAALEAWRGLPGAGGCRNPVEGAPPRKPCAVS